MSSREPSNLFPQPRDFASLSVRDLLDAREAYHVYLSALANVTGTAIGRYWIDKDDWYATNAPDDPGAPKSGQSTAPKTLLNGIVRPWSWPCVLVFVKEWRPRESLGDQAIPRRLQLPDGRVIPTCVILAAPEDSPPPSALLRGNSSAMIGGGYQCIRRSQGIQRIGTVACLVQREGMYYGLTNKHVAGASADRVEAVIRGELRQMGFAEALNINKHTLPSLFPGWPGERTLVNIDAGLIRVDDASGWTSQVYGIGEVDELFDATPNTVTLDLIGCPVRAFGGASGVLEGEIKALFFRYKSLGGYDYVADVLVGPRPSVPDEMAGGRKKGNSSCVSQPGDSGTLWFYDPPNSRETPAGQDQTAEKPKRGSRARRLRPIAMQWGGERFAAPEGVNGFALATFLSSVCRLLDVEIVRDWGTGYSEYWGKIAHFSVGWKACDLLDGGKLAALMKANQARIGFSDEVLGQGAEFHVGREDFVPLADVPDYVWVSASRYVPSRKLEGQQHFADIDIKPPKQKKTIIETCIDNPKKISAGFWLECFNAFKDLGCGPEEGSLPFRIWQIWEAMVECLRDRSSVDSVARFLTAAGVLAHYVGDASMPFHCSYLHHGRLPMKETPLGEFPVAHGSEEYKAYSKTPEAKIHGIYDEGIMEIETQAALSEMDGLLSDAAPENGGIETGYDAAKAAILMMGETRKRLSAEKIIDADDPTLGPKARARRLWSNPEIREAAVVSLASSVKLLAGLWVSAWKAGDGDSRSAGDIREFRESECKTIYKSRDFLPALSLEEMAKTGKYEAP